MHLQMKQLIFFSFVSLFKLLQIVNFKNGLKRNTNAKKTKQTILMLIVWHIALVIV